MTRCQIMRAFIEIAKCERLCISDYLSSNIGVWKVCLTLPSMTAQGGPCLSLFGKTDVAPAELVIT